MADEAVSTRERLVQAARQCLVEHGYAACSVKRIAGLAGVNHGLVHHYFGSKEALFIEVMAQEQQRVKARLTDDADVFVARFFAPEIFRNTERVRLFLELCAMGKSNRRVAEHLREHLKVPRAHFRRMLQTGDDTLTPTVVFAACFGLALQGLFDEELPVEQAANRLMELVRAAPGGPGSRDSDPDT